MKKFLFAAAALLAICGAPTAASASCGSGSCNGLIDRLFVYPSGIIFLEMEGDMTALMCQLTSGAYIKIDPATTTRYEEVYSLLLSARMSDSSLFVRTNDTTGNCTIQYIISGY